MGFALSSVMVQNARLKHFQEDFITDESLKNC